MRYTVSKNIFRKISFSPKGSSMRAILSVANREGLAELARDLQAHDVAIFSTSGTLNALQGEGIQAEAVSTLTRFPEIFGGRVKTLQPAILGGVLARSDLPAVETALP